MKVPEDCGCCSAGERLTPASGVNPPGLSALSRRVGTQPQFAAAMRAALTRDPVLARLTTHAPDDPSLALLDAWAVVLDVLAFYDERILNEGFLETATERRSLLELARAIGYEMRPGVAASTLLAFTVDDVSGAPEKVQLEAGLKVQSVPGQDEKPQVFETIEPLEARRAWNALPAQDTELVLPHMNLPRLWVKGTSTRLRPGDAILIVGKERERDPNSDSWDFRFVEEVTPHPPAEPSSDPLAGYTVLKLHQGLGSFHPFMKPALDHPRLFALRTRASVFGHNAPDWNVMPDALRTNYVKGHPDGSADRLKEWPHFQIDAPAFPPSIPNTHHVDLDAVYPGVVAGDGAGGWLVLTVPDYRELFDVLQVREVSRSEFAVSAKVTRVKLLGEVSTWNRFQDHVREVAVYAQSEPLQWAERPIETPLAGDRVSLRVAVADLAPGRRLLVTGREWKTGTPRSEAAVLAAVEADGGASALKLTAPLRYRYDPSTVRVCANVAAATHGDTKADEHLGSGDGSQAFQRFDLKQKPLTYVPAPNALGGESTLKVSVDGVRWEERPSLYGVRPEEPVFATRRADDGTITVQFGDGKTGALLPTGVENVRAAYRVGTGLAGNVRAGALTTLLSRPLGLKEVTNPLPAEGGQGPETPDQTRRHAPLTVLTLDRIVSLIDFEDFAAAFLGVGKAQATWLWDGERRLVHLTVAGAAGAAISRDSTLFSNLRLAIDRSRSPEQSVRVDPFSLLTFDVRAKVVVEAARDPEAVTRAVAAMLREAFSFEARAFAQGVSGSEVLAVMQRVPGVAWVDLDRLAPHRGVTAGGLRTSGPNAQLPARPARWDGDRIAPAELLLLDPDGLDLVGASE